MHRILFAILVPVLILASPAAFALRCGNSVINQGLQDFQVRERCGAPFWADDYYAIEVLGVDGPIERQREIQYDVWYYNFGPRELMRRLVFRDGVLMREDTLGYGVRALGADCAANRDYTGLTAGELVARCGEPAARRRHLDTIVRRPSRGVARYRDQRREDWIYDFGDNRLVRVMRLVDDRVIGMDTLKR
ncbi:MAG TPA: DUF2845 domain-containing protein [Rhodanobacteraceae bacterium]|nr:DUF2845 domain-containing protein [Rhodanobacteraceae bacterium]